MNPIQWKDARWLQRRQSAEAVQAAIVRHVDENWRTLGIPDPKLFFALGVWLGKPTKTSAFFITKRLADLGMPAGGPRLGLFVPRSGMMGLFLWLAQVGSKETPEDHAMKRALGTQGYECLTAYDANSGVRIISEYLGTPNPLAI